MKKLNVRLIRMIGHSKGQFFSIATIVAAALSVYILFNITGVNIKQAVADYYQMTNMNDIQIQLVKIPAGALKDLSNVTGIKEVQGRLSFDVPMRVADEKKKVTVRLISQPAENPLINKLYKLNGMTDHLEGNQVVVLQQLADARKIKLGDTLTPFVNGRERNVVVKGVAASSEFIYLMENEQAILPNPAKFGVLFVSEAYARSVYGYTGQYNEVQITLTPWGKAHVDDVVTQLEKELDPYGVKRITKLKDQLSDNVLTQKLDGIDKMANILPVMFLMVGGLIIVIMLSRIVSNDRIAIGVLKALGYGNGRILGHYAQYALLIGLCGSVVGITAGMLLSGPLSEVFVFYFNIPFVAIQVYWGYLIKALVLTSVFCIGSGLLGARAVLGIMPADSMRPEAPKSGKRILLERIPLIWSRLAFSWKIVIRNIMRTKRRFILLVLGLSVAYAINTVPMYMGAILPQMFKDQYSVFQKMDYVIDFAKPLNQTVVQDLQHLIKAQRIEPKVEFPFELKNGWYKKNVAVVGVSNDTQFYAFYDLQNRLVKPKPGGILVSEGLARSLHVKVGDRIVIRNFIPQKHDVTLEVSSIIKQHLGSGAYMEIGTMQSLLVDRQMVTGALVTSHDDVKFKLKDVQQIAGVRSAKDVENSFMEYLDTIKVAYTAYMIFGGILGFAIVYNSTIIGIAERRMEFASLRVMGFDKRDIFSIVTRENTLLALCAIMLGIPLGMGMISSMANSFSSDLLTLPVNFSPAIFANAAFATAVFLVVAQLATKRKVDQLDFIDALKSRIS